MQDFKMLTGIVFCLFVLSVTKSDSQLQGHLLPLGMQGAAEQETESTSFALSGRDFYKKHVRASKPIIFKNAASRWPALKNWQNLRYLKFKYGKNLYNIDFAKRFAHQDIAQRFMPLKKFLAIYKVEDVCLESNVSDSRMLEEVHLPTQLQCKELYPDPRDVNIVMSSGNVSAPLYQAQADILRVSLSGYNKVLLFDKKYTKLLYKSDYGFAPYVSNVIPDQVDLEKFPEFSEMTYYSAELFPGDMLYVPRSWWMQSTSAGEHRVGVNIWFNPFHQDPSYQETMAGADMIQATNLYDEFLDKQPLEIECSDQRTSLSHVLKINVSDPKNLGLRIPRKNERPSDVTLASGYTMPVLGLGTALLNENTTQAVEYALKIGYRLFDSAQGYPGSEKAIAMAIKQSSVPRSEIFIVTKLHPRYLGYNSTLSAIDLSLERLGTSYIDLFLIHSKECDEFLLKCEKGEPEGTWQDSWRAMEHAHKLGKVRSLGVSNFYVTDLKELIGMADVPVSVVQNWFDPMHQDLKVRKFCQKSIIRYMGFSTLGGMWVQMGLGENPILTSSLLTDLSTHYDYVVSHVVLRWAIHNNVTVIPRSSNQNHIAQNLRALDISLSEFDIREVDSMASVMDDLLGDMFGSMEQEQKETKAPAEANAADSAGVNEEVSDGDTLKANIGATARTDAEGSAGNSLDGEGDNADAGDNAEVSKGDNAGTTAGGNTANSNSDENSNVGVDVADKNSAASKMKGEL